MKNPFGFSIVIIATLLCGNCLADTLPSPTTPSTVIVTGASGELGSAIAKLLAKEHSLILTGRTPLKLQKLQEQLKAENPYNYEIANVDYSDQDSIAHFKSFLDKAHSSLAGLVLISARPNFKKGVLPEENEWLQEFQINFTGPLEVLKATLPHLTKGAKIVVISGVTSIQFKPEYGPTCVIRRMWSTYTKALTHQLGPQGITINALSPDVILTQYHIDRIQKKADTNGISYDEQMTKEVVGIPLERHAQPSEVAQTVKFLLSQDSDFINGINLILDGGATVSY